MTGVEPLTLPALLEYLIPALVATGIVSVIGAVMGVKVMRGELAGLKDMIQKGFENVHRDIADLKARHGGHEDRLRSLEIRAAFKDGRDGTLVDPTLPATE
ncbi:hypothetical protein [Sulfitobacter sp. 1A15106]|uniref:hypothetical protein n=1 Tax=Sulfitobacter sp. 1A15106 TaxID=3368590 RepID=UPI0037472236